MELYPNVTEAPYRQTVATHVKISTGTHCTIGEQATVIIQYNSYNLWAKKLGQDKASVVAIEDCCIWHSPKKYRKKLQKKETDRNDQYVKMQI